MKAKTIRVLEVSRDRRSKKATAQGKVELTEAQIIVSGGRGLKGPEHFSLVSDLAEAMGAAVGCFTRAVGLHVPRARFAPVKATCDLLAVRSDVYALDDDGAIRPAPGRDARLGPPVITLAESFYKGIDDFEARFPHALSLLSCRSLTVEGDLSFGRDVAIEGDVVLRCAQSAHVPAGKRFTSGTYEL